MDGISTLNPGKGKMAEAAESVHATLGPTPQICWPLLSARTGTEVWVKHENHLPTGAFKVRGGIVYMARLRQSEPAVTGVIAATRGNHGQSVAFGAALHGLKATIVVPEGNSRSKNAAMKAFGAELIEHGHDFQAALEHARDLAAERKLHFVQSFHAWLIEGVSTYGYELFSARSDLDTVYVPIGLGSGICSVIAARDAFGLRTRVVGVVSENAAAYALSFKAGKPVSTNSADTIADGMACRVPVEDAVAMINRGADRIVEVTEAEIRGAMRIYFEDTHNVAEGAGAAPLAALLKEGAARAGAKAGLILSGGNVDSPLFRSVLG
ncbi:MAG TPA: threonine dehydratase [Candidatus Binatia bacterium]|nr:threonine dehydratase [Candidatus Binatia bacterium]